MGRQNARSGLKHAVVRTALPFIAGLMVGWLLIGWWLWPVQQTNSAPWLMRRDYQERYLRLVAAYYRHTGDLQGTREALKGWDSEKLTTLLRQMASRTEDTDDIAQLAAALSLPVETRPLANGLLDQDFFLWTILLSASPLVIALVLAIHPLLKGERASSSPVLGEGFKELDTELGALLSEEHQEDQPSAPQTIISSPALPHNNAGLTYEGQSPEEVLADIFGKRQERLARYAALAEELEEIPAADLVLKARRVLEQIIRSNEALG